MDLSIISGDSLDFGDDDSFLCICAEEMDKEVTQIFKKWKINSQLLPKQCDFDINTTNSSINNETFDSRTYTRPRKTETLPTFSSNISCQNEIKNIESGKIALQLDDEVTPSLTQKSWLLDVSPPSSICTSMDFQNTDNILNSLINSNDFSNISFLLNSSENRKTISSSNNLNNNTVTIDPNITIVNKKLMDFTFTKSPLLMDTNNCTYVANADDTDLPLKEIDIENVDTHLNESVEDFGRNLTFNKYNDDVSLTWSKIQSSQQAPVIQSTPVHSADNDIKKNFDNLSPISSQSAVMNDDACNNIILRDSSKSRKLVDHIHLEDYRNSIEDQCEFLLNEETIKLSSRLVSTQHNENKEHVLYQDEKEFDRMLDSFNVKRSIESEKLLLSVDTIKQRHSFINVEKQRESKQKNDNENNKILYDAMINKSSERLLNRRIRLNDDDDANLQSQKNYISNEISEKNNAEISNNSTNDNDRFKTIRLNRPRLQTGIVIVDTKESLLSPHQQINQPQDEETNCSNTNKERQNLINKQRQVKAEVEFKKPSAIPSKLSKYGSSLQRLTSKSNQSNLNSPLKANSTDSLDNQDITESNIKIENKSMDIKSSMGIKSKSIHNLMFNGAQHSGTSNFKLSSVVAKSQTNLKGDKGSKILASSNQQNTNQKMSTFSMIRPSSGYYGNAFMNKRLESDNESNSLSSSSASSRNSVHLSLAPIENIYNGYEENVKKLSGAIPKSSAISRPIGGILQRPITQQRSGLPRPSFSTRR